MTIVQDNLYSDFGAARPLGAARISTICSHKAERHGSLGGVWAIANEISRSVVIWRHFSILLPKILSGRDASEVSLTWRLFLLDEEIARSRIDISAGDTRGGMKDRS